MERKTGKRGQLMGGLFTMLLFLVFILSAHFYRADRKPRV